MVLKGENVGGWPDMAYRRVEKILQVEPSQAGGPMPLRIRARRGQRGNLLKDAHSPRRIVVTKRREPSRARTK